MRALYAGAGVAAGLFLLIEPVRAFVVEVAGWGGYLALRVALIAAFVASLLGAIPKKASVLRPVPKTAPGEDPLLLLRAFACGLVVLGHGFAITFVPSQMPARMSEGSLMWLLMANPWMGVWVFFVLSGYLMGKGFYSGRYPIDRAGVRNFYWNRFWRIAPTYYIALIIIAAFVYPDLLRPASIAQILGLLLFWQGSGTPSAIIGALWSVQTEVGFYLLAPALFAGLLAARRFVHPALLLVAVLAGGLAYRWLVLSQLGDGAWMMGVMTPVIGNLDLFLAGMLLNWVVPSLSGVAKRLPLLTLGFAALAVAYVPFAYMFSHASYGSPAQVAVNGFLSRDASPTIAALVTLFVILSFECWAANGGRATGVLGWVVRRGQLAGLLTYSVYVWHEPIFKAQMKNLPPTVDGLASLYQMAVAMVLTAVIAYGSYHLIEKRFERMKAKTARPVALAEAA